MKQTYLILLLTILTFASYACECRNVSFTQQVRESDNIFIGTVLKRYSDDKVCYLFSITQMFKGSIIDTLTIKTGFGGGDCGEIFEIGKTYVVFSNNKETNGCYRNSLADKCADLSKLKYLFQNGYSSDIGITADPKVTDKEAGYFNGELLNQRKNFDFHQKKVALFINEHLIDKQQYFASYGGKDVVSQMVILTEEEKQKTHGYDVIIVLWSKQTINKRFKKRLIKKLL